MTDFRGLVDHSGEFFHISHGDYAYVLGLDKSEMAMLGVVEVSFNANIRALLRDEHRGRASKPHYRRVQDIPEEQRYISLSFSEMRRRSIKLCSETSFKRATPALEKRGYIKTRFVRYEGGKIIKVYPCVGQCKSEGGDYYLNLYDWRGDDPHEIVCSCVRQYLLCPETINRDKHKAQGTFPNGPDNPEEDNDAPYYYEDMPETEETSQSAVGKNIDLSPSATHRRAASVASVASVGKNTDLSGQPSSFVPKRSGKSTEPVGTFTDQVDRNTDLSGRNTDLVGESTQSRAHSRKGRKDKNPEKEGKKGAAAATSAESDGNENEWLRPGYHPPLPEIGRWERAECYQLLAHYLGNPLTKDIAHFEEAAFRLYEKTCLLGEIEARRMITIIILFMRYGLASWKESMPLHAWHIEAHFDEMARKSAGWSPPAEFAADLDALDERLYQQQQQAAPVPFITVEVEAEAEAEAAPVPLLASGYDPVYQDDQHQGQHAPPLATMPVEGAERVVEDLTSERAYCVRVGLPEHFARPVKQIADLGFKIAVYRNGTVTIRDEQDVPVSGFERLPTCRIGFSIPIALEKLAQKRKLVQQPDPEEAIVA